MVLNISYYSFITEGGVFVFTSFIPILSISLGQEQLLNKYFKISMSELLTKYNIFNAPYSILILKNEM